MKPAFAKNIKNTYAARVAGCLGCTFLIRRSFWSCKFEAGRCVVFNWLVKQAAQIHIFVIDKELATTSVDDFTVHLTDFNCSLDLFNQVTKID